MYFLSDRQEETIVLSNDHPRIYVCEPLYMFEAISCDFHDREGVPWTIYFSLRAVLPCKPNKEPRTSGPHTTETSIFSDHKAHRENEARSLWRRLISIRIIKGILTIALVEEPFPWVWPVRKQTVAAGISTFMPAAGRFTSRKQIRFA